MSRRQKGNGPSKGQGGGGRRHPRSMANLVHAPAAPAGNGRAVTHGFRSELLVRDVEDEIRELMDALAEAAPIRDPDGGLPGADVIAVETAARALKRWRSVSAWCDLHGRVSPETHEVRPAARYELEGERALQRCLDSLGMSPMARSRLGLNIARTAQSFDLARHWQEQGGDDA
jgi:hypothetical protein